MKKIFLYTALFSILFQYCSYLPEKDKMNFNYVQQETNDYVFLAQENKSYDTCFIFIPGGLVDPHVYMCWMNELVKKNNNFSIILLKIPSNLAILNQNKVKKVIKKFPETKTWIIGGHSLGGVVAATSVSKNQNNYLGLILMASWPIKSNSLENWKGDVLSISASNDGLATPQDIDTNKIYLPSGIDIDTNYIFTKEKNITYYFQISGGNHSGFGCYGFQNGDNDADILPEEQQKQFVKVISNFIHSL